MEKKKLDKLIEMIREEMMTTGSTAGKPGFSSNADSSGPTAGFDPTMKLDGRSKLMRRLPPPYRKSLTSKKKR